MPDVMFDQPPDRQLRALAGRALVAGLCVAAAVAIVALVSGSFDEAEWRVVGTSLGFSVFSCTAAAGSGLVRHAGGARAVGMLAVGASAAAWALLVSCLWIEGAAEDIRWRGFGIAGLAALWSAHAALVLAARRPADSTAVRRLGTVSIVTLGIDALAGVVALLGWVDAVHAGVARMLAALLVVALLSTALPPILRRQQPRRAPRPTTLASEVAEVAERLSEMDLPPQAYAEIVRLRELARTAGDRR